MRINKKKILVVSLTLITLLACYLKLTHGIETDEEMHVANLYRTSMNYKSSAFTTNWDPYQLVTFIFFPILKLFAANNYEGVVLGLRCFSLLFQFVFCCYLFAFSKKYLKINNTLNYIICALCFLTSPKVGYTFDHSNTSMWFVTIAMLELYKTLYCDADISHIYTSGISFSFAVLSHPGNILMLVLIFVVFVTKKKKKYLVHFFIPCILMALLFFLLFLKNNSLLFKDFMFFVKEFTNDGSHKNSIIGRIDQRIIFIFLFLLVTSLAIKKSPIKKIRFVEESTICEIIYFEYAVSSIIYNLFISNAICVFSEKYIFLGLWLLIVNKHNYKLSLLGLIPVIHFVIIYLFSNQGIQSNAYYMLPITAILYGEYLQNHKTIINKVSLVLTCIAALLIVGYNVRIESTMPSNIFDNTFENDRILLGIKTLQHENDLFEEIKSVNNNIDKLTIISEHPHCLSYLYLNSEIIAPSCVSTPIYNSQWVDYFEYHNIKETYLLFDKDEYTKSDFFTGMDFGKYLSKKYNFETQYEGNHFDIIKITR